ncbi:hypothetical protein M1M07_12000 [Rhodococcus sp. HM1]|uniref:hypothetical protein n=1 Tax=Rhodococcus sp. HM1 TaxID=2937759 RepID=UPI00200B7076|nr:hypothetical protein [Rhodococcus sp. HM1]MCK8671836.1 hypothetical protein [Rhodococcus sp. HM1]
MTPSRSQIELWKSSDLTVTASNLDGICRSIVDVAGTMRNDVRGMAPEWTGIAFDAAAHRADDEYDEVRRLAGTVQAIVDAYDGSARELESMLEFLRAVVAEAEELFIVGEDWALTPRPAADDELRARQDELADYFAERIRNAVEGIRAIDGSLAAALEALAGELSSNSPQGVPPELRESAVSTPGRLTAASIAFDTMFGRRPATAVDWRTAMALDTTSYLDKNQGVRAEVVVGRIEPVPGQGIVRMGLFIPAGEVVNFIHNDLGDDRDEDPTFDPERTRVSLYVDYENGVVIARQNPSVGVTGEVEVGAPAVNVQQLSDGSVRLVYEATNALPPLDSEALTTFHSVKGDIVLAPGPERVGVAAQIGNYPSLEIYQDSVSGSTQQIYIDPADSGSKWGPLGNLPFDHTLGDYSSATERFDGVQPMALQEVNLAWAHGGRS